MQTDLQRVDSVSGQMMNSQIDACGGDSGEQSALADPVPEFLGGGPRFWRNLVVWDGEGSGSE